MTPWAIVSAAYTGCMANTETENLSLDAKRSFTTLLRDILLLIFIELKYFPLILKKIQWPFHYLNIYVVLLSLQT